MASTKDPDGFYLLVFIIISIVFQGRHCVVKY